jgi:hypothetical protein
MAIEQMDATSTQKIRELIFEAMKSFDEIDALKEATNSTIKAVSEEFSIPPAIMKKAISIARKGKFSDEENKLADIERILSMTGHKN